jgi:exosortase/archaeosortase family protein
MNWIQKYFNYLYFFKLIALTIVLNYFFVTVNGLVSPEGKFYSSFVERHLDFIQLIRYLIMQTSNCIAQVFGTNSYISGLQMINIGKDIEVEIWYPCLGLGVISFWISFIVTNIGSWRKKISWCIWGIICISIINSLRIALLLISLDRGWEQNSLLDHHDMFNIAAYVLVGLLMYTYNDNGKQKPSRSKRSLENIRSERTESLI